jgi:DNA-binding HxlR family transcriptional regulator
MYIRRAYAILSLMRKAIVQQDITPYCPLYRQAIELIGKKWSGAIIRALLAGSTQFSEFSVIIPGVSDRLISVRLKELESNGIVERIVIPDKPVRIQYQLTEKGRALGKVVVAITEWAEEWIPQVESVSAKATD